ncbi:MAG: AAA family ATPase [Chloroflexota bacterium]
MNKVTKIGSSIAALVDPQYNSLMSSALAYLPLDRRYALAKGVKLADQTTGSVLFADISGFTPLTEALVHHYGRRRGADELARHFNQVFHQLISQINRYGGSVIGFAGDAITCWFDEDLPIGSIWSEPKWPESKWPESKPKNSPKAAQCGSLLRSLAASMAMQEVMDSLGAIRIGSEDTVSLAVKIALSSGSVRRFLVGDANIQVIEVLAGGLVDQVAAAEGVAEPGEIVIDQITLAKLPISYVQRGNWRGNGEGGRFAPIASFDLLIEPVTLPHLENTLDEEAIRSWVLPPVYSRLNSQERFLAEIRPAVALFIKFDGIDYETDFQAEEQLDQYIRWIQSVVDQYEGALIQLTTGDKGSYLYIAFGAPIAHDDNAQRAAAAALALSTPPPELSFINQVQMGITQGQMRVGAYGGPTRQTYAVLGDATNLAARLMSRATVGQILVNQLIADEIVDHFELQELGFATLKGKREPTALYSLLRARIQKASQLNLRYHSPLVGREPELAQVTQVIRQALEGHSQILRIEGEAGIGKSHFAAVILEQAQRHGMKTWLGSCQSTGQDSVYLPFRQIVRQLLELPPVETSSLAEQKQQIKQVETTIQNLNPGWLVRMPLLGDLLGIPIPETPTTAAFKPQLRREALTTLLRDLMQSIARQQPFLLLIEDIHWMDEASQELLLALGRSLSDSPLLLLLLHRPRMGRQGVMAGGGAGDQGLLQRWEPLANETHLVLNELSADGTASLVANQLSSSTISPLALELIQGLAQGNPFYVEELVDALLDSEKLMPVDGSWVLTRSVFNALRKAHCVVRDEADWHLRQGASLAEVDLGIPDSIHGIVLSRLDRLPEPVKLTLKVASVIGHIFEFDMLAQAHPAMLDSAALLRQISLVEDRDFARLEAPDPQRRYIFRHNITQEVVYRTLLDEQRQELHLAVGQAIEQLQPDAVERLAYHYNSSDLRDVETRAKALRYLGTAGDRAKRDYANETALAFYDRALMLEERWDWIKSKIELNHLMGQRQEELELLDYATYAKLGAPAELALLRSIYFESISEYDEAQTMADQALLLSQEEGDPRNEARSLIQTGQIAARQGSFSQQEDALLTALEVGSGEHLMPAEEVDIHYGLGIVYRERSEYGKAQSALNDALFLAQSVGDRSREAMITSAMGFTYQLQRQFTDAYENNQLALKLAREIGDRERESSALISVAQVLLEGKGDIHQAITSLQQALMHQDSMGNLWWQALICNTLGVAYNDVGQYELAEGSIQQGLNLIDEIGFEAGRGHLLCNLGETYREFKGANEALPFLTESLSIALRYADRATQAYSYTELAATQLVNNEYLLAIENAKAALGIQKELGMHVLTASSLAIAGVSQCRLHQNGAALEYARESLEILDKCQGIGPQYPLRAYYFCFQIFDENEQSEEAQQSLQTAYQLLIQQASKISNDRMKDSFLAASSIHRSIHTKASELGLVEDNIL